MNSKNIKNKKIAKSFPSLVDVFFHDQETMKKSDVPHMSESMKRDIMRPRLFVPKKKSAKTKKSLDSISLLDFYNGEILSKAESDIPRMGQGMTNVMMTNRFFGQKPKKRNADGSLKNPTASDKTKDWVTGKVQSAQDAVGRAGSRTMAAGRRLFGRNGKPAALPVGIVGDQNDDDDTNTDADEMTAAMLRRQERDRQERAGFEP
jgi:hypothetical protein